MGRDRELGNAAVISLRGKSSGPDYLKHLTAKNKRSLLELLKSLPVNDYRAHSNRRALLRILAAASSDTAIRDNATKLFDVRLDLSLGGTKALEKYRAEEAEIFDSFFQRYKLEPTAALDPS